VYSGTGESSDCVIMWGNTVQRLCDFCVIMWVILYSGTGDCVVCVIMWGNTEQRDRGQCGLCDNVGNTGKRYRGSAVFVINC
jgi:hypothetical protein